ncbi:MAG TPA: nitrilase-related carbon-nitrogen hydrolase, partial [Terriglobales bacterium]|nr:nitrilase-related carbon-nitrogen hydrolase [Terriglobales bacterium]
MIKIAVAQLTSSTDKKTNLAAGAKLMRQARDGGADLIVFPEFLMAFSAASQTASELAELAESIEGPFVGELCAVAKASGIATVATIYERAPISNRVYDTALWIDAAGKILSMYRKLHLYDAFGFKESDKFHPGADIAPLTTFGDGR